MASLSNVLFREINRVSTFYNNFDYIYDCKLLVDECIDRLL